MFVIDISNFKNNISSLVNFVIKSYGSITIKTKKGNVVLLSEEKYKGIKETIYLYSQGDTLDKIKEGEKEEISLMSTYDFKNPF